MKPIKSLLKIQLKKFLLLLSVCLISFLPLTVLSQNNQTISENDPLFFDLGTFYEVTLSPPGGLAISNQLRDQLVTTFENAGNCNIINVNIFNLEGSSFDISPGYFDGMIRVQGGSIQTVEAQGVYNLDFGSVLADTANLSFSEINIPFTTTGESMFSLSLTTDCNAVATTSTSSTSSTSSSSTTSSSSSSSSSGGSTTTSSTSSSTSSSSSTGGVGIRLGEVQQQIKDEINASISLEKVAVERLSNPELSVEDVNNALADLQSAASKLSLTKALVEFDILTAIGNEIKQSKIDATNSGDDTRILTQRNFKATKNKRRRILKILRKAIRTESNLIRRLTRARDSGRENRMRSLANTIISFTNRLQIKRKEAVIRIINSGNFDTIIVEN